MRSAAERSTGEEAAAAAARLLDASAAGDRVEVILVVEGSVRPIQGSGGRRWRVRLDGDHVLTFRAEWVVAARAVSRRPREP
jgi:hypothetical protein